MLLSAFVGWGESAERVVECDLLGWRVVQMSAWRRSSLSGSPRWERILEAVRLQKLGPVCLEKTLWGAPIVVVHEKREEDDALRPDVEKRRVARGAPTAGRVRRCDRWRRMPDSVEISHVMVVRLGEMQEAMLAVVHVRPA